MTFKARFAQNLIGARKQAGLTQEEVAARASLARDTICKHEGEAHVPILDVLVRLAGAVAIPPADLLDGISYRPSFVGTGEGRYEIDGPPSKRPTARRVTTSRAGTDRRSSAEPRRGWRSGRSAS